MFLVSPCTAPPRGPVRSSRGVEAPEVVLAPLSQHQFEMADDGEGQVQNAAGLPWRVRNTTLMHGMSRWQIIKDVSTSLGGENKPTGKNVPEFVVYIPFDR